LSGFDNNATILVDSVVFPALTDTVSNIVSNPGHWELASVDKKGHLMQSESFISSLLGLLSVASLQCQVSIIGILYGIASSPQASGNSL
jgi:hypothetical protein